MNKNFRKAYKWQDADGGFMFGTATSVEPDRNGKVQLTCLSLIPDAGQPLTMHKGRMPGLKFDLDRTIKVAKARLQQIDIVPEELFDQFAIKYVQGMKDCYWCKRAMGAAITRKCYEIFMSWIVISNAITQKLHTSSMQKSVTITAFGVHKKAWLILKDRRDKFAQNNIRSGGKSSFPPSSPSIFLVFSISSYQQTRMLPCIMRLCSTIAQKLRLW